MSAFHCTSHKYTVLSTHFDGRFKRIKLSEIFHKTKITNSDFAYALLLLPRVCPSCFSTTFNCKQNGTSLSCPMVSPSPEWVSKDGQQLLKRGGLLPISNQQTVAKCLQL